MDISLLSCLRGAGERLRPVLERRQGRQPLREIIVGNVLPLKVLGNFPLRLPAGVRFLLNAHPLPNSKLAAVVHELTEAGIDCTAIWTPGEREHLSVKLGRLIFRLPLAVATLVAVRWRSRRLDRVDLQVVVGRTMFRRLLRRSPGAKPIIISDVSPDLHMLWSAAVAEGNGAVWWQDDYHHQGPLPYHVCAAAVLNQAGLEAVRNRSLAAQVVLRPQIRILSMRPIPPDPRVGVAMNGFFVGSPEQRQVLSQLKDILGVAQLRIRLHPTSTLSAQDFPKDWIRVAPPDEPLAVFAQSIDVAIVGNSAVQLRLLCAGVPVLHIPELDPHGYDLYGYCRRGFTFGAETMADISLPGMSAFYLNPVRGEQLRNYVNVREQERLEGLDKLL